jgi:hypothetical protein
MALALGAAMAGRGFCGGAAVAGNEAAAQNAARKANCSPFGMCLLAGPSIGGQGM